jgi:hypothetical protein
MIDRMKSSHVGLVRHLTSLQDIWTMRASPRTPNAQQNVTTRAVTRLKVTSAILLIHTKSSQATIKGGVTREDDTKRRSFTIGTNCPADLPNNAVAYSTQTLRHRLIDERQTCRCRMPNSLRPLQGSRQAIVRRGPSFSDSPCAPRPARRRQEYHGAGGSNRGRISRKQRCQRYIPLPWLLRTPTQQVRSATPHSPAAQDADYHDQEVYSSSGVGHFL